MVSLAAWAGSPAAFVCSSLAVLCLESAQITISGIWAIGSIDAQSLPVNLWISSAFSSCPVLHSWNSHWQGTAASDFSNHLWYSLSFVWALPNLSTSIKKVFAHVSHFYDATILWSLSTLIPVKFSFCEKRREKKHHGQFIYLALLAGTALADSLLHVVGFLSKIHHWLCRCCCLSLLGISVQVTDLQVLLGAGYWTRQTSALTQDCCSYDSQHLFNQWNISAWGGKKTEHLLLFTRA